METAKTTTAVISKDAGATRPEMKQELITVTTGWTICGLAWSHDSVAQQRIAVGSYREDTKNVVRIYDFDDSKKSGATLDMTRSLDLTFPATKLSWHPKNNTKLISAGDHLRLWDVPLSSSDNSSSGDTIACEQKTVLENDAFAPLTSFSWNREDEKIVASLNYDPSYFSCSIWDIQTEKQDAHILLNQSSGSKGYDVAFREADKDIFASVGEDGCMRVFDLRSLKKVSVVYEAERPLFRIAWNCQNPLYVALLVKMSKEVIVVDLRSPRVPVLTLSGHMSQINAVTWAPHSASHICTAGDDKQSYVWDLSRSSAVTEPMLSYGTDKKINNLAWPASREGCVALAAGARLEVLRV